MSITFNQNWKPNNVLTDAATATIGVFDNTSNVQVVNAGTPMTHVSTGSYAYTYAATDGHLYTATITITGTTGAVGIFQQVVYAQPQTTVPSNTDDGSSSYISTVWADQRGLWTSIKYSALGAIATALALGEGPSYSISGRVGNESLSLNEFLSNMRDTAKIATEMEIQLTEALQSANPFEIRQCVGVRSRWQG